MTHVRVYDVEKLIQEFLYKKKYSELVFTQVYSRTDMDKITVLLSEGHNFRR